MAQLTDNEQFKLRKLLRDGCGLEKRVELLTQALSALLEDQPCRYEGQEMLGCSYFPKKNPCSVCRARDFLSECDP